jgi:[NiFe] hydrogenase diaphorase moiety large subunit
MKQEIAHWRERFGCDRSALLPILEEIQKKYTYVPNFAMQVVADLLNIHPVEVYGVVSFYSFLSEVPQGRFIIRLCRTITCDMAGKTLVARQLENDLGIKFGESTPDGMFKLEYANCLGMCDQGPAMLVNERVYTRMTPEKVHDILEECRRQVSVYATESKEGHLV